MPAVIPTRRHAMVVEDDAGVRQLVAAALRDELRLSVVALADGRDAIAALGRGLPALLVLDLRLPVVDGFGVLRWLRRHAGAPPVVAITGQGPAAAANALALGCRACVEKPFGVDELVRAIRPYLPTRSDLSA